MHTIFSKVRPKEFMSPVSPVFRTAATVSIQSGNIHSILIRYSRLSSRCDSTSTRLRTRWQMSSRDPDSPKFGQVTCVASVSTVLNKSLSDGCFNVLYFFTTTTMLYTIGLVCIQTWRINHTLRHLRRWRLRYRSRLLDSEAWTGQRVRRITERRVGWHCSINFWVILLFRIWVIELKLKIYQYCWQCIPKNDKSTDICG